MGISIIISQGALGIARCYAYEIPQCMADSAPEMNTSYYLGV